MDLIKNINEDLRAKIEEGKDPFEMSDIRNIPGVKKVLGEEGKCGEGKCGGAENEEGKCGEGKCGGAENEENMTHLTDDQLKGMAAYVREMMKNHGADDAEETIRSVLDDVAGFETASEEKVDEVVKKVLAMLDK